MGGNLRRTLPLTSANFRKTVSWVKLHLRALGFISCIVQFRGDYAVGDPALDDAFRVDFVDPYFRHQVFAQVAGRLWGYREGFLAVPPFFDFICLTSAPMGQISLIA